MRVRAIDSDGDWLFGKGRNDYKVDRAAIAQNIKTRLQMFLADCFFALDQGIDWFNLLGSRNIVELRLVVSATILNTEGVTNLVELSFQIDENRNVSGIYEVETVYGNVQGEF